jgi:3-oxoacyl-[acyl-carrier-protein] synthase II
MPHFEKNRRTDGRRRVVITGMGIISPLGRDPHTFWSNLLQGKSGIQEIRGFPSATFACRIAGQVIGFQFPQELCPPSTRSRPDRRSQFALAAAEQAFRQSQLKLEDDPAYRRAVYLGAGEGTVDLDHFARLVAKSRRQDAIPLDLFLRVALEDCQPEDSFEIEAGLCAMHLAARYQAQGPNLNCLTACAASSQALGEAFRRIQCGEADIIISGGAHSMIQPLDVIGFIALTALSSRNEDPAKASRPFDAGRDGFVLGEGAGILILEELEHALRRGAEIHAEIIGYGSTADAYRVTDTHPDARGATAAMRLALEDAGVSPDEIDYINAHGTSTVENDATETLAIKEVFGKRAYEIPISSTKSMIGHLIAAAGAVELIACILTLRHGMAHATINYETPDPLCDLDYIPNQPRKLRAQTVLSNSFGFGGQNVALVVRKFSQH